MEFQSAQDVRKARDKATERIGTVWTACGIGWLLLHLFVSGVPVLGTLTYWGIYVGAVIATALAVRAIVSVRKSADQQIAAIKNRGGF